MLADDAREVAEEGLRGRAPRCNFRNAGAISFQLAQPGAIAHPRLATQLQGKEFFKCESCHGLGQRQVILCRHGVYPCIPTQHKVAIELALLQIGRCRRNTQQIASRVRWRRGRMSAVLT